jgi:membrane protease YdiL (CAAX protease family)
MPRSIFVGPRGANEYAILVFMQLCNGLAEELAMRGYFITRFEAIFGSRAQALLLSTILFAAYHIYQGAIGVIGAAIFGLMLGGCFLRYRRVWPLALAHAIIDVISFMRL